MSMVVEKVGLDKVKAKLAGLKRSKQEQIALSKNSVETIEQIEERLDLED